MSLPSFDKVFQHATRLPVPAGLALHALAHAAESVLGEADAAADATPAPEEAGASRKRKGPGAGGTPFPSINPASDPEVIAALAAGCVSKDDTRREDMAVSGTALSRHFSALEAEGRLDAMNDPMKVLEDFLVESELSPTCETHASQMLHAASLTFLLVVLNDIFKHCSRFAGTSSLITHMPTCEIASTCIRVLLGPFMTGGRPPEGEDDMLTGLCAEHGELFDSFYEAYSDSVPKDALTSHREAFSSQRARVDNTRVNSYAVVLMTLVFLHGIPRTLYDVVKEHPFCKAFVAMTYQTMVSPGQYNKLSEGVLAAIRSCAVQYKKDHPELFRSVKRRGGTRAAAGKGKEAAAKRARFAEPTAEERYFDTEPAEEVAAEEVTDSDEEEAAAEAAGDAV